MLRRGPPTAGGGGRRGRHGASPVPGPSREELFAFRVQLAEAALRRLHARPPGISRARLARAEGPGPRPHPRPALPNLRGPQACLRRRPRASQAPPTPSLPPAGSWWRTTRSSRRGRGSRGPRWARTTSGRTRTSRPGRKARQRLNAAAMPVSVSSAHDRRAPSSNAHSTGR